MTRSLGEFALDTRHDLDTPHTPHDLDIPHCANLPWILRSHSHCATLLAGAVDELRRK